MPRLIALTPVALGLCCIFHALTWCLPLAQHCCLARVLALRGGLARRVSVRARIGQGSCVMKCWYKRTAAPWHLMAALFLPFTLPIAMKFFVMDMTVLCRRLYSLCVQTSRAAPYFVCVPLHITHPFVLPYGKALANNLLDCTQPILSVIVDLRMWFS